MMIDRLFLSHPRSVGEGYFQHMATSAGFGATMIAGGLAALVHALAPCLFGRAASDRVKSLYGRMKARQPAFAGEPPAFAGPRWQLEYEI